MLQVSNPERGCGTLVEGGTYAVGMMSEGGLLQPWTWLLGKPWPCAVEESLIRTAQPVHLYTQINPQHTLESGEVWLVDWPEAGTSNISLPKVGLINHVGAVYYTAWDFAQECRLFGPSRRINQTQAKVLAPLIQKYGAIPCLFTHSNIPECADPEHTFSLFRLTRDPGHDWNEEAGRERPFGEAEEDWLPTWRAAGFGATVYDSVPRHPLEDVLKMVAFKDGPLSSQYVELRHSEAIFGMSWFTRVVYIIPAGEDEKALPADLREAGVEAGRAVPVGKEEECSPTL